MSPMSLGGRSKIWQPDTTRGRLYERRNTVVGLSPNLLPNPGNNVYQNGTWHYPENVAYDDAFNVIWANWETSPSLPPEGDFDDWTIVNNVDFLGQVLTSPPMNAPLTAYSAPGAHIHIVDTALPARVAVFGSGTNGQPVEPCSQYLLTGAMYGAPTEDITQTSYLFQYDEHGNHIAGGTNGWADEKTDNFGFNLSNDQLFFDTHPLARYIRIEFEYTGRSANHDVYLDLYQINQRSLNARVWGTYNDAINTPTQLLTPASDSADFRQGVEINTAGNADEGPDGGHYEGHGNYQWFPPFGASGPFERWGAWGPFSAVAGATYQGGFFVSNGNNFDPNSMAAALLWLNTDGDAIGVSEPSTLVQLVSDDPFLAENWVEVPPTVDTAPPGTQYGLLLWSFDEFFGRIDGNYVRRLVT